MSEVVQINVGVAQLLIVFAALVLQLVGIVVAITVTFGKMSSRIAVFEALYNEGKRDVEALARAIGQLEQRHHVLRNWITIFAIQHRVPPPEDVPPL